MSVASMLNASATIKSKGTKTSDTMGGYSLATASTLATSDCRLRQMTADEARIYDRDSIRGMYRMYIEPVSGLTGSNWVVIGSSTYNVVGINNVDLADELMQVDMELVS